MREPDFRAGPEGKHSSPMQNLQGQLWAAVPALVTQWSLQNPPGPAGPALVPALPLLQPHDPTALIPAPLLLPAPFPYAHPHTLLHPAGPGSPHHLDRTPGQDPGVNPTPLPTRGGTRDPCREAQKHSRSKQHQEEDSHGRPAWGLPWSPTAGPPGSRGSGGGWLRSDPPTTPAGQPAGRSTGTYTHAHTRALAPAITQRPHTHRADVFLKSTGAMMEADP